MAQFWERRALREEAVGARDEALLSRLQTVLARSSIAPAAASPVRGAPEVSISIQATARACA